MNPTTNDLTAYLPSADAAILNSNAYAVSHLNAIQKLRHDRRVYLLRALWECRTEAHTALVIRQLALELEVFNTPLGTLEAMYGWASEFTMRFIEH